VAAITDVSGANRYFGWYYTPSELLGPALDALRKKRPDKPLSVSEYGAGGAISQHTDDPLGGPFDSFGRVQPEEYQASSTRRTGRSWSPSPICGRPGCGTASTSPPATATRATARASTPRAW
jgi:hypothetical protein